MKQRFLLPRRESHYPTKGEFFFTQHQQNNNRQRQLTKETPKRTSAWWNQPPGPATRKTTPHTIQQTLQTPRLQRPQSSRIQGGCETRGVHRQDRPSPEGDRGRVCCRSSRNLQRSLRSRRGEQGREKRRNGEARRRRQRRRTWRASWRPGAPPWLPGRKRRRRTRGSARASLVLSVVFAVVMFCSERRGRLERKCPGWALRPVRRQCECSRGAPIFL